MMQLLSQLSMMAAEAEESTEERVERLENVAAKTDVDENTLFDVEEDLRRYVKHRLQTLDGEEAAQVEQLKQQAPAMMGVPADDVEDVAAVILARMLVAQPERVATIVHNLDEILLRTGLYEEVDDPTVTREELPAPIDLDVGEVEAAQGGMNGMGLDVDGDL